MYGRDARAKAEHLADSVFSRSNRMLERLGLPGALETARLPDDARAWDALAPGTATSKGDPLFPRFDPPEVG